MANKPLPYPYKRISLQVPLDVVAAFELLGATTGRAGSRLMVEFLSDSVPAILSMEREVRAVLGSKKDQIERMCALASAVNLVASEAMDRASAGPLPGHAQRGPEAVRGPLTPPSSNTGGKVPKAGENLARPGPKENP